MIHHSFLLHPPLYEKLLNIAVIALSTNTCCFYPVHNLVKDVLIKQGNFSMSVVCGLVEWRSTVLYLPASLELPHESGFTFSQFIG